MLADNFLSSRRPKKIEKFLRLPYLLRKLHDQKLVVTLSMWSHLPIDTVVLTVILYYGHGKQINISIDHIPKKGIINATPTEETTSAVLRRMKHQKLLETLIGSSSSILLASGFISRAYLYIVKEANKSIHLSKKKSKQEYT